MEFRRLTVEDLPLMHRWLNEAGVIRWWEGDDVSWEGVQRDYSPDQADSTEHWLALEADQPIGWVQCYDAVDNPDEAPHWFAAGVDRAAAGIDYLVGDPDSRSRGLGSRMLDAFVTTVVFVPDRGWTQACASPYEANTASWRALEKAGFTQVGRWTDDDGALCRIMARDRSPGT